MMINKKFSLLFFKTFFLEYFFYNININRDSSKTAVLKTFHNRLYLQKRFKKKFFLSQQEVSTIQIQIRTQSRPIQN